jgi:hypothetical protein
MQEASHPHSILNPLALDLAARDTERIIERHTSPLIRFYVLTSFLRATETLPASWTTSYYRNFYPAIRVCIRHPYVCWTDPEYWMLIVRYLATLNEHDSIHDAQDFSDTMQTAWEKAAASMACMGEFESLHALLRSHEWVQSDPSPETWQRISAATTIGSDAFKEYLAAFPTQAPPPDFLIRAETRLRHAYEDARSPGVILLPEFDTSEPLSGLVLHPACNIGKSETWRIHFNNLITDDNTKTHGQLELALSAARTVVERRFDATLQAQSAVVRFHEHDAAYSGESMGLAVALQLTERLQESFNRDIRLALQPGLCCSGGVASDGAVSTIPVETVASKVRTAWFSPCNAVLLHSAHLDAARTTLQSLRERWPMRRLELYGVMSLDDCLAAPGIINTIRRNPYDRGKEFLRRHSTLLVFSIVLLLMSIAGYFWWKSLYGYSDLEYSGLAAIGENALVYNPKRAAAWQFRDYRNVREAGLHFGDLEVGADATRNIWLWNMTPSALDAELSIGGPAADQWYISWNGGKQRITATDSLRVMIKYVPTRESAENVAWLRVSDPDNGKELTHLRLTGAAGPPLSAGYALYLNGVENLLHFGENAIAFARDEGTLEFWFRPDTLVGCLFSNNRNIPYGPAIQNMTLAISDTLISVDVGNNNASTVIERGRLRCGEWHHLALSFSRTKASILLMLDGDILAEKNEEFIIEYVANPFVTFGAYYNGEEVQGPFRGALDEIRMWESALPPDTIRSRMRRKVPALSPALLGYWDFDVIGEVSAFNANERTQDGRLINRPSYIRSAVPLEREHTHDVQLHRVDVATRAIVLPPMRWLQCGSDPIEGSPERSYALRFRPDPSQHSTVLTLMNQDAYLTFGTEHAWVIGKGPLPVQVRADWNEVIIRIDASQTAEAFLNGYPVFKDTSPFFARGPTWRYEGLQLGIFHDKYNTFGPKYYDSYRPALLRSLGLQNFRVWRRYLSDEDIAAIHRGELPRDGLVAHWPLDALPDANNNFIDLVGGHFLHVWRYLAWL